MRSIAVLITAFCWTFIFPSEGFSISRDSLAAAAGDSLLAAGKPAEARIEYERAAFYSTDPVSSAVYLLKKADVNKQLGQHREAYTTLSQIPYNRVGDSLAFRIVYEAAVNAYLSEQFAAAESEIRKFMFFVRDSSLHQELRPLLALSLSAQNRWKDVKAELATMVTFSNLPPQEKAMLNRQIDSLLAGDNQPKLKKMKTAQLLAVFPGLGHMYLGYEVEGVMNFLLQTGSLAFGVYCFLNRYYVTSVIFGYGFFAKFRTGAQNRLEYLTGKRNHRVTEAYRKEVNALISGSYQAAGN